jgi:hypothetical protein
MTQKAPAAIVKRRARRVRTETPSLYASLANTAIRPKPTAERRQRATPRRWLEVALVTAAVGAVA